MSEEEELRAHLLKMDEFDLKSLVALFCSGLGVDLLETYGGFSQSELLEEVVRLARARGFLVESQAEIP